MGEGLRMIDAVCEEFGIVQAMHPHVGTLVETKADVDLALEETDVLWTLDTGHLAIGGVDPVAFARENADRVGHAHLKDVNMSLASAVLSGDISLIKAVQDGIFVPFGQGDVNIAEAVLALEAAGYAGRYVLEQDCAIMGAAPAEGAGPLDDVRICLDYLAREVEPRLETASV
jgi:inosose dehydratase